MVSKPEHLVSGRYSHQSFAVLVPLISRTERKTASYFLYGSPCNCHMTVFPSVAPAGCITSPYGHLCWRWATFCLKPSSIKLHL